MALGVLIKTVGNKLPLIFGLRSYPHNLIKTMLAQGSAHIPPHHPFPCLLVANVDSNFCVRFVNFLHKCLRIAN